MRVHQWRLAKSAVEVQQVRRQGQLWQQRQVALVQTCVTRVQDAAKVALSKAVQSA